MYSMIVLVMISSGILEYTVIPLAFIICSECPQIKISENFSSSQGDLQQQVITLAPLILAALADLASSGVELRRDRIKALSLIHI